jgi:hypothetical protein
MNRDERDSTEDDYPDDELQKFEEWSDRQDDERNSSIVSH